MTIVTFYNPISFNTTHPSLLNLFRGHLAEVQTGNKNQLEQSSQNILNIHLKQEPKYFPQTDRWTDEKTDGQIERRTNRETEIWSDGQTDK